MMTGMVRMSDLGHFLHAHLLKLKAEGKVTGTSVKSAWKLA